ncbi:unnamed protein product [Linum trigynum]|uniref:Secreted protein n=1 Tax=Linum trigynum TaxID=586398 RepID=A0AAV2F836_9ROSI
MASSSLTSCIAATIFEEMMVTCGKLASCSASTWTTIMVGVDGCDMLAGGMATVADGVGCSTDILGGPGEGLLLV